MHNEPPEPGTAEYHPSAPYVTRAIVYAGMNATSYRRAGCGEPVVLLCSGPEPPLLAPLAARFRVIAPELPCEALAPAGPGPAVPFSAWLRDFLDGLGVGRASLVADEPYALRALSFSLTDPARVDRVALVFHDAPDPALSAGTLPELLGHAGHPLLVRCETGAGGCGERCTTIVGDVLGFLSGRARPDP